jgi:hypothetical protein
MGRSAKDEEGGGGRGGGGNNSSWLGAGLISEITVYIALRVIEIIFFGFTFVMPVCLLIHTTLLSVRHTNLK